MCTSVCVYVSAYQVVSALRGHLVPRASPARTERTAMMATRDQLVRLELFVALGVRLTTCDALSHINEQSSYGSGNGSSSKRKAYVPGCQG